MSDLGDRGRRRKKRGIKINKHYFQEPVSPPNIGRPIILTKPPLDRQTPPTTSDTVATKSNEIIPTVILKARDDSSSSSGGGSIVLPQPPVSSNSSTANSPLLIPATMASATAVVSSTAPQSPVYQIQQKSGISTTANTASSEGSILDTRLVTPTDMKTTVKLIDENFQWCDNAVEFLQDQSDYFVIGVIGLQGIGKSTLMSYLAGNKMEDSPKSFIFKCQSRELRELGEHATTGIDIFMTPERIILLDVQKSIPRDEISNLFLEKYPGNIFNCRFLRKQPVLSASVMDHMMQYEKKYSSDYTSIESVLEIQSLQIAAFLMAVCHTVLVVQGWMCDPSILRFIQAAEMLKPSAPATIHDLKLGIEDQTEYFPHLVFVHTHCQREDFTSANISAMQELYSTVFQKSKLKFKGPIGIGQSFVMPSLYTPNSNDLVNLFLIPDQFSSDQDMMNSCFPTYQGHPGYGTLIQTFCSQVLSLPHHALTHTGHSEKNWFHYAARTWELVKKSNLFMEYSRLLP